MNIRVLSAHSHLYRVTGCSWLVMSCVILSDTTGRKDYRKKATIKPADIKDISDFFFFFLFSFTKRFPGLPYACLPHFPHISVLLFIALPTFTLSSLCCKY